MFGDLFKIFLRCMRARTKHVLRIGVGPHLRSEEWVTRLLCKIFEPSNNVIPIVVPKC